MTLKLNSDPMPAWRADAVKTINAYFAQEANSAAPRAMAHRRKAEQAAAVLAGRAAAPGLVDEAAKRGLLLTDFAKLVASKAGGMDDLDAIELRRQSALLAVDKATTPAELNTILNDISKAG